MLINEILNDGIGRTLAFLGREAGMVDIGLSCKDGNSDDYNVHIDTETDFIYHGKWYTGTSDMDAKRDSRYDKKVKVLMETDGTIKLTQFYFDTNRCLHLYFDNSLEIHSRLYESEEEDKDRYVWLVFYPWVAKDWVICYPDRIEIEPSEESQEYLNYYKKWMDCKRNKSRRIISTDEANKILCVHSGRRVLEIENDKCLCLVLERSKAIPYTTAIYIAGEYHIDQNESGREFFCNNKENNVIVPEKETVKINKCYIGTNNDLKIDLSGGITISSKMRCKKNDYWHINTLWGVTDELRVTHESIVAQRYKISQDELDHIHNMLDLLSSR